MLALALLALCHAVATDTLVAAPPAHTPVLDGVVSDGEYGPASICLPAPQGTIRVWVRADGSFLYVAAQLPDSTFYWGDDCVVSFDPSGSSRPSLREGDRQWYVRRLADSSLVRAVVNGRWRAVRGGGPLGPARSGSDWELRVHSSTDGWSVELRIARPPDWNDARAPRVAFRVYDDRPQGWVAWPLPPAGAPAQDVEEQPALWAHLRLPR